VAAARPRTARARAAALPPPRARLAFLPSGRSLLTGLALLAAAAGLYAAARETSMFAIDEVRVEGAPPGLVRQIEQELAPLTGRSLVGLDGDGVLAQVEALPGVRSASYDRAFPHTLVVRVVRERPAVVLRRGAESWLVSARGRVLRQVEQGAHAKLPRIWLPKSFPLERGDLVGDTEVLRSVLALRAVAAEELAVRIRTVRGRGGELTFVLASGLELRLGEDAELALKVAAAGEILPLLDPPGLGGPTYLDLSVPERPVAGTTLKSEVEVEG
jgi:cell division septal protein FtsQ